MALGLPSFSDVPDCGTIGSVEAFLHHQRQAVAGARYAVELEADAAWLRLPPERRAGFAAAAKAGGADDAVQWRRAWWLHAIGGRPRAPFEIATSSDLAAALIGALRSALAPDEPPADLPREIDAWWRQLTAAGRDRIAEYSAARVAGAASRLRAEGALTTGRTDVEVEPGHHEPEGRGRRKGRRRPPSRAEIRRIHDAASRAVSAQERLDRHFIPLGPVCGACTHETGGCCSLTVPLLWREADYRLLALGQAEIPAPSPDTPGACPFLGRQGCRLSPIHRPYICRSFLCERAEQALGDDLDTAHAEIGELARARARLAI